MRILAIRPFLQGVLTRSNTVASCCVCLSPVSLLLVPADGRISRNQRDLLRHSSPELLSAVFNTMS